MPIRLLRWMRSKDSAMAAFTPSRLGPLAAQSREEPGAVFFAGQHHQRPGFRLVRHGRIVNEGSCRSGNFKGKLPSLGATSGS